MKAYLYAIDCGDGIYCGQTQHLPLRIWQHFNGCGAEFTKRHKPLDIIGACFVTAATKRDINELEIEFARHIAATTNKPVSMGVDCACLSVKSSRFALYKPKLTELFDQVTQMMAAGLIRFNGTHHTVIA
jgi:predicted GIY-YIG superfamily endonuclease